MCMCMNGFIKCACVYVCACVQLKECLCNICVCGLCILYALCKISFLFFTYGHFNYFGVFMQQYYLYLPHLTTLFSFQQGHKSRTLLIIVILFDTSIKVAKSILEKHDLPVEEFNLLQRKMDWNPLFRLQVGVCMCVCRCVCE